MTSSTPKDQNPERPRWLIAAFENEGSARRAVHDARVCGVAPRSIRIGNSLDGLTSIDAEKREEPRPRPIIRFFRAFGRKQPSEEPAETQATIVAMRDGESARHALLDAQPKRIDVFGAGGFRIGTLLDSNPQ